MSSSIRLPAQGEVSLLSPTGLAGGGNPAYVTQFGSPASRGGDRTEAIVKALLGAAEEGRKIERARARMQQVQQAARAPQALRLGPGGQLDLGPLQVDIPAQRMSLAEALLRQR